MDELSAAFDVDLLARIEDAGINASAPPQQLWQDGWLLRFSPGKAKRARCINAVATGQQPLDDKLQRATAVLSAARLPLIVRITPWSQPPQLDAELAARGLQRFDDTRVMVLASLASLAPLADAPAMALPAGCSWVSLDADAYAQAVGHLRGSPADQQAAHAQRLRLSPVPYRGHAIRRDADGAVLACGQIAQEGDLVGLYDVFTRDSMRGQGLGTLLCQRLLTLAAERCAAAAYLQVESDNVAARRIYQRLGFADAYAYHYRQAAARGA